MDTSVLQNGLTVLIIGFSIVFSFLVIMIFAMQIMGKVVAWLNKLFPVAVATSAPVKTTSSAGGDEIAIAIAAALLKKNH